MSAPSDEGRSAEPGVSGASIGIAAGTPSGGTPSGGSQGLGQDQDLVNGTGGARTSGAEQQHISLCEALDRILNKGAVVVADLTISVADIDLIYINLQALITSVETGRRLQQEAAHERQSIDDGKP
ncbi:MAG: gas vesicle protein [Chromatiaceae bacterium]|nr:gas vesicle protein [Chromatiaceae bacterium]MCF8016737.1 gas vesicle protein [Chromatiaceae bacterium]